jgi:hypothetical protein
MGGERSALDPPRQPPRTEAGRPPKGGEVIQQALRSPGGSFVSIQTLLHQPVADFPKLSVVARWARGETKRPRFLFESSFPRI